MKMKTYLRKFTMMLKTLRKVKIYSKMFLMILETYLRKLLMKVRTNYSRDKIEIKCDFLSTNVS